MQKIFLFLVFAFYSFHAMAQDDLLSLIANTDEKKKEHISNAFKSTRVISGHSMEFIGKGVLDVRILHRFGPVNSGLNNLFGLDQANMRVGFDYGISNNISVGVGRSNVGKEWDAFIKLRPVWQSAGKGSIPFSVVLVSGAGGFGIEGAPFCIGEVDPLDDFEEAKILFHIGQGAAGPEALENAGLDGGADGAEKGVGMLLVADIGGGSGLGEDGELGIGLSRGIEATKGSGGGDDIETALSTGLAEDFDCFVMKRSGVVEDEQ